MNAVLPDLPAVDPLPKCWADSEVFGADGKAIKHVKRLLKPLRGLQAGILGARASVGLNLRTGLTVAMVGHLDGEAGEAALTEALLPKLAAAAGPERPWVAVLDRLYCNLNFPQQVLKAGGHFLIRYCTNTTFLPDAARPAQESRDAQGHRIVQEWGWLGKVEKADRLYVRRITKSLPDGKAARRGHGPAGRGEVSGRGDAVDVSESLGDRDRVPPDHRRVLVAAPDRHDAEGGAVPVVVLPAVVQRTASGARPPGVAQGCEAKTISNEKLFYDVKRQLVAVSELVEVDSLLSLLGEVPAATELRECLRERLRSAWSDRWWKAPGSGRGGHQKVKTRVLGNHTSTYRVLGRDLRKSNRRSLDPLH